MRSRRSSRCISTNSSTTKTMPIVASGCITGDSIVPRVSSGPGGAEATSTTTGFCPGCAGSRVSCGCGAAGCVSALAGSLPRPWSTRPILAT